MYDGLINGKHQSAISANHTDITSSNANSDNLIDGSIKDDSTVIDGVSIVPSVLTNIASASIGYIIGKGSAKVDSLTTTTELPNVTSNSSRDLSGTSNCCNAHLITKLFQFAVILSQRSYALGSLPKADQKILIDKVSLIAGSGLVPDKLDTIINDIDRFLANINSEYEDKYSSILGRISSMEASIQRLRGILKDEDHFIPRGGSYIPNPKVRFGDRLDVSSLNVHYCCSMGVSLIDESSHKYIANLSSKDPYEISTATDINSMSNISLPITYVYTPTYLKSYGERGRSYDIAYVHEVPEKFGLNIYMGIWCNQI